MYFESLFFQTVADFQNLWIVMELQQGQYYLLSTRKPVELLFSICTFSVHFKKKKNWGGGGGGGGGQRRIAVT